MKSDLAPLTDTAKAAIIDDLVRKYPRGPGGTLKQSDYQEKYNYDNIYERYMSLTFLRSEVDGSSYTFGYRPIDLYKLGFTDQWEIRRYFRYDRDLRPAASTRRANRVWSRIQQTVNNFIREGYEGVWEIKYSWREEDTAAIYAGSRIEAETYARTFLNAAFGQPIDHTPEVLFKELGDVTILGDRNDKFANAMKTKYEGIRKTAIKRHAEAMAEVATLEARYSMTTGIAGFQLMAALDSQEEAAA